MWYNTIFVVRLCIRFLYSKGKAKRESSQYYFNMTTKDLKQQIRRDRIVTARFTKDEYEKLQKTCSDTTSLSDFVRNATHEKLNNMVS